MIKNRTFLTVVGFLLVGIGFLSLILSLVGIEFSFLNWLRSFGPLGAFLVRLGMILGGFILIYLGQTDWEREEI